MSMTPKEMADLLIKNGFVKIRQKGSHAMYKNSTTNRQVTVPMHAKDLPKGLENAIKNKQVYKEDYMKRVFYLAVFHEENNQYWVSFPDFPECFSQGDSLEDSFLHAQEALEMCVEERLSNKEKLPKPTLAVNENGADKHVLLSCECDSNMLAA